MDDRRNDEGFGLTEIMVSMLILAILMMAILSLLITAITTVAENSTRASASEFVTDRIERARSAAATGDCGVVSSVILPAEAFEDGRGVPMELSGELTCDQTGDPHDDPTLATVTVRATTTDPSLTNPVAEVTTDIFVKFDPEA
ncbi:type IV pilus modification PilV family protein [Demequina sp. SO4-18]|uniref:type IV pilus modification PilV family protein n=1 Tax=Demequina sp. SO4-18 TaxID=3401026 RepID=UPI003B5C76E1